MSARLWMAGGVAAVGLLVISGAATLQRGGPQEGQPPPGPNGPVVRTKADINSAPAADLEHLPGITQKLSQRIIANRPYRKIDDLVRRKVLGRKQLAEIKEYITVGPPGGNTGAMPSR